MIEFWIVDGMSCVFLHTDQLLVENEFCKCPKSGTLVTFQLPLSQLLPGTNGEFRWSEGEQCYCISSSKSIRRANSVERVKWMYGKGEMKWSLVKIEDCRWGGSDTRLPGAKIGKLRHQHLPFPASELQAAVNISFHVFLLLYTIGSLAPVHITSLNLHEPITFSGILSNYPGQSIPQSHFQISTASLRNSVVHRSKAE